jgi:hypothetical protein
MAQDTTDDGPLPGFPTSGVIRFVWFSRPLVLIQRGCVSRLGAKKKAEKCGFRRRDEGLFFRFDERSEHGLDALIPRRIIVGSPGKPHRMTESGRGGQCRPRDAVWPSSLGTSAWDDHAMRVMEVVYRGVLVLSFCSPAFSRQAPSPQVSAWLGSVPSSPFPTPRFDGFLSGHMIDHGAAQGSSLSRTPDVDL